MKIYIGTRQIEDESYRQVLEPETIEHIAEDSECTIIILDGILRRYHFAKIPEIIKLCKKKLRLGGVLKIIDIDFDLLTFTYQKLGNIKELNNAVMSSEMRSFITMEALLEIVKAVTPDLANVIFSRIHNIEFDVEFSRK